MMRGLLAKEWRDLRPFLVLELALIVIDMLTVLLMPSEQQSLGHEFTAGSTFQALFVFGLAFAIGSGLLVREIDGGTLQFLDGLPVTRSRVFGAKLLCGILVLLIEPFGETLLNAAVHLLVRDSLDYPLHPWLLVTHFGLMAVVGVAGLCLGLLLGFMRFIGWLMLALGIVVVNLLKHEAPSLGALLDPTALLARHFVGDHWPLPWATLGVQLGLALLCCLLALGLFNGADGILARFVRWRASGRLSARVALPLLWFVLGTGALGGGAYLMVKQASADRKTEAAMSYGAQFKPIAAGHANSRHYTFSYPVLSGERVNALVGSADKVFEDVAALLKIDGGAPIDVDLGGTTPNHSGTAYYDRIRMYVGTTSPNKVLAHETSHVFAQRLAGGEKVRELVSMVVFNEGLASWVESRLSGGNGVSEEAELVAAIVSARHMIKPRQLADLAEMARGGDEELKYPLGAILIDQFVRRYGPAAPSRLLRTLARADFPHNLHGYVLWQTAFQLSGFDVDLVFDDYARHLKQLELKYAPQIAELARPRGRLVTVDDSLKLVLQVDTRLPSEWTLLARLRPTDDSPDDQFSHLIMLPYTSTEAMATVPVERLVNDQVCFQPGLWGHGIYLFEAWTCLPVSSAVKRASSSASTGASAGTAASAPDAPSASPSPSASASPSPSPSPSTAAAPVPGPVAVGKPGTASKRAPDPLQ
jgi:hypothetical protein